jgi:hypothetical protein
MHFDLGMLAERILGESRGQRRHKAAADTKSRELIAFGFLLE